MDTLDFFKRFLEIARCQQAEIVALRRLTDVHHYALMRLAGLEGEPPAEAMSADALQRLSEDCAALDWLFSQPSDEPDDSVGTNVG